MAQVGCLLLINNEYFNVKLWRHNNNSTRTIKSNTNKICISEFLHCADDCGFMTHHFPNSLRNENQKMASSSTWQSKLIKLWTNLFVRNNLFRCSFFYHLFTAVYRNIGFHQNEAQLCKAMSDLVDITYASCLFSVIFFLWFRQRALYTAFLPMARFTKLFNFFSFISIVISSVLGITGIILLILTNDIAASSIGCIIKNNRIFQLVTFMISGIAIIFGQVSLLVAFIHVLIVMQEHDVKERWKSLFCCKHQPSIEHTRGQPADETKTIVDKIIRKQLSLQLCLCSPTCSLFL